MQVRPYLLLFVAQLPLAVSATAQTQTNRVVCAIEAPICARADVDSNETAVYRSNATTRTQEKLWSVPEWLRVVRVAESGATVLVEIEPFNQLPPAATADLVVLRLYANGSLFKEFRIKDFFSGSALRLALQAPAWSKALGGDTSAARYLLADGRQISIQLSTGEFSFI